MKSVATICLLLLLPALLTAGLLESRRGNFRVGIRLTPGDAGEGRRYTAWVAGVSDRSGAVLYTIEREIPYGSPFPRVQVSDNAGEAVMVDAFSGIVEFYNARGSLVRRWLPYGVDPPDHERILKCEVSGDRATFLLSASAPPQARVVMCTVTGEERWSRTLVYASASEIAMSDDGGIVIASSYHAAGLDSPGAPRVATEIIDGNGAGLHVLPVLMRHASVSPSRERFVVADRDAIVFGFVTGDEAHRRWSSGLQGGTITAVACAGDTTAVVVEQILAGSDGIRYANPAAIFLNAAGIEMRREVVSGTSRFSTRLSFREGRFHLQNPDTADQESGK